MLENQVDHGLLEPELSGILCNSSLVQYSHPDFGTVYLPLQPMLSTASCEHQQTSFIDTNKHPIWLAELLAWSVYDFHPEIPSSDWNWFVYKFFTVCSLAGFQDYTFIDSAWSVLQHFFEGYYQPDPCT